MNFDLENTRRQLIAKRVAAGADSEIGHRCSNLIDSWSTTAKPRAKRSGRTSRQTSASRWRTSPSVISREGKTMPERRNHARSVYPDEEAAEFMPWLIRLWDGLTPAEKASAAMVARQSIGMVMVGLEYTVEKPAVTNGDRGSAA